MMQTWISEPFTTPPAAYMRRLLSLWLGSRWWIIALFFAIFIIASALDVRFLLVGLMLIFLVYPMLMATLCIKYLLTPKVRRAVLTKQVEIRTPDTILITYPVADESAEVPLEPDIIPLAKVKKVRIINGDLILILDMSALSFIIVPMHAFGTDGLKVAKALYRSVPAISPA